MLRNVLFLFIAVIVVIQFFHPDKNIDASDSNNIHDISRGMDIPDPVADILQNSCYDCHSNNTEYPWYAEIQPLGWWLNHHITEGKREVNFNEFTTYSIRRQYKKLEELVEQVKKGDMPLGSYTLIHRGAILNQAQKTLLTNWAEAAMDSMKARYPADSFTRKN